MIIAIASGKGGTGKTTVAVNLALSITEDMQKQERLEDGDWRLLFLDCDVEEPNAHLFLNPTTERREEVGVLIPEVDYDKCTFCGRCAEVCAYHALAVVKQQVLIFPELCHGCGSCSLNCPEEAIHEVLNVTGVIEEGQVAVNSPFLIPNSQNFRFAHGILNIGEAMAVPVIRQLKKRIGRNAADRMVILDASPGTSCPVVETVRGADWVLMVTEPTPFGLHDLKLAVAVARDELGLPVGVVINRDGVAEPTLAANLGELVAVVRERFAHPVAVLTNSSLMKRGDVRQDLALFDVVVAKVDAPDELLYQRVNRPFVDYTLAEVLWGIRRFREEFQGKLALQMIFVEANQGHAAEMAEIARDLSPDEVQLNTPLRPGPVPPLSPEEMGEIEAAFAGLPVLNVYKATRPEVVSLDEEETQRRRPQREAERR